MNKITIKKVIVKKSRLEVEYEIIGEWKKYFKRNEGFFVEYSKSIEDVPKSIAIIPFLCNILPISWVFNATIILDEIDKDFYESIEEFKNGYIAMYPKINFSGNIDVMRIVSNKIDRNNSNAAAFFSGGVDAYQTLISHINEKVTLVTLWGADVKLDDTDGWSKVNKHIVEISNELKLNYVVIRSSFRKFINEGELSEYVYKIVGDGWWHGFQHGIGLIGHMAPYAYKYKINTVYIASSFTIAEKGKVTCASDPSIDNYVKFCGCKTIHDGYKYSRQEKIKRICDYVKKTGDKIKLRVCWESIGGSNCCQCEKCYRTIFGILAERQDPREFGFDYTEAEFKNIIKDLKNRIFISNFRWEYIQNSFRENYNIEEIDKELMWFYKKNINELDGSISKRILILKRKIKNILLEIKKKVHS